MDTLLLNCRGRDLPDFSLAGHVLVARVVEVYDGDTFRAVFCLPASSTLRPVKMRCRLLGVNAPEMRPPRDTADRDDVVRRARESRRRLVELITSCEGQASDASIDLTNTRLVQLECSGFDKYGRLLVRVEQVAECLLREGYCVPYDC